MTRNMQACIVTALWTLALLFVSPPVIADTVTFEMIPNAISANDMSPDGRYIAGETSTNRTYVYDTRTSTMTILPPEALTAVGVSDDGSVVVGEMPDPDDPDPVMGVVAARWTETTGWVSLGYLPNALECPSRSDGYEVSADGSVVVGLSWDGCSGRGFWWTQETGMLELEPLANGSNRASVVSADGTLIGGFAQGSFSRTPAIWDDSGAGQLLDPPNGDAVGEVHGIRDDGTVLLGTWLADEHILAAQAVKWTSGELGWERELLGAGSLLPGWQGIPMDIADNGTIVGFDIIMGNRRAWIQPGGSGPLVLLETFIESGGGVIPKGLTLEVCQAISADGRFIVGHGFYTGAWRVTIDRLGDIDADGDVDLDDAEALVNVLLGSPLDPDHVLRSDLNDDGMADGLDIPVFIGAFLEQ